ncbi:flagellar export protein FliJ [Clostridium sp. DL1XJH146]
MKKFEYSLQSVLKYKEDKEDSVKEVFLKLNNKVKEQEEILESLNIQLEESCVQLHNKTNLTTINLKNCYSYMYTLQDKVDKQEKLVKQYKEKLEEIRKKLIIAQKERKTIEVLKEKEYDSYKKEIEKEEQKLNDELGLYAYLRKATI